MSRQSILIIDENEDFLASTIEFLTIDMQVDVVTWAVSVEEAADKVGKYKPDIIILDLATPKFNDMDFSVWSKSIRKTKVIVTSFYDNPDYRFIASEAGADNFIVKDEFKESIVQLLNNSSYSLKNLDEFILPLN